MKKYVRQIPQGKTFSQLFFIYLTSASVVSGNRKWQGVTGRTISTSVKHLETYIFALTIISFKDFPFLKDIFGGSLKISLRYRWFCTMCQFFTKAYLMFGTDGWYCVTKGRMSFLVLCCCLSADALSVK